MLTILSMHTRYAVGPFRGGVSRRPSLPCEKESHGTPALDPVEAVRLPVSPRLKRDPQPIGQSANLGADHFVLFRVERK